MKINKITFSEKALPLILKALDIKTDIPHNEIAGIYKGKIIKKDLLSIMELVDEINGSMV